MKKAKNKGRTKINIPKGQLEFENKPWWFELIITLIVALLFAFAVSKIAHWFLGVQGISALKSYVTEKLKGPS